MRGQRGVSRSCLPSHSWAAWPTFLTGRDPGGHGVFDILEYRPGATRRLPVSVSLHPRSHLARAPLRGGQDDAAAQRAADVPAARDSRGRRSPAASCRPAEPSAIPTGGGRAARLADQRWLLDDVPSSSARPGRRPRGPDPQARRGDADAPRRGALGRGVHRLRLPRPASALPARVRSSGASPSRGSGGVAGRRSRPRRLPPARPGARDAPRAHRRRRPRRPHVRSRSSAVHARSVDEQGAGAPRVPALRARLGPREPARVGSRPVARAGRLRPPRAARPGRRSDRADRLGAHDRVHERASRPGRASPSTSPDASRTAPSRAADYERVRDEVAAALLAFTDPETGAHPIGGVLRKEDVLSGPYLDRAPDLLLQPAPLYSLTHARQLVEAADWLSGDHRPEGVYAFAGAGVDARRRPGDLAGGLRGPDRSWRRARGRPRVGANRARGGGRCLQQRG